MWLVAVVLLLLAGGAQAQGRRVALVVGNSSYKSVERLANAANDARLMATTLKEAGFTIIGDGPQLDLDKPRFERAVQAFGRALQGADVALFYYSGHGLQVDGVNWLVPVDASPTGPRDLDFQMVDASLVLRQMEHAGTKLNMVLLDACRNNPFAIRGVRGSQPGLAEMRAPEGTLISYATQPGNVASDGSSSNSPYTAALAAAMHRPGADVFQVFNQVGLSVKQVTGGQQQPWLASSPIAGNFFFFNGPVTIVPPAAAVDAEAVYWQSIASSRSSADFQTYLSRFPRGTFVELAQRRLAALTSASRTGAFDGTWLVLYSCTVARDGAAGFSLNFLASVRDGVLHGERGVRGQARSLALDGQIQPDGSAMLAGQGVTGNAEYSVGRIAAGTPYRFYLQSRFEGTHGMGKRLEVRPCEAVFTKQ